MQESQVLGTSEGQSSKALAPPDCVPSRPAQNLEGPGWGLESLQELVLTLSSSRTPSGTQFPHYLIITKLSVCVCVSSVSVSS